MSKFAYENKKLEFAAQHSKRKMLMGFVTVCHTMLYLTAILPQFTRGVQNWIQCGRCAVVLNS